jgi:chromosome segregation ATPase
MLHVVRPQNDLLPPCGDVIVVALARLRSLLGTIKSARVIDAERKLVEARDERAEKANELRHSIAGHSSLNAAQMEMQKQLRVLDAKISRARRELMEAREAFMSEVQATVRPHLAAAAPTLQQAADLIEGVRELLAIVDQFAHYNALIMPVMSRELQATDGLRALAHKLQA